MNKITHTELMERIIETSYYITKYAGKKDYNKVERYRSELNKIIDSIISQKQD